MVIRLRTDVTFLSNLTDSFRQAGDKPGEKINLLKNFTLKVGPEPYEGTDRNIHIRSILLKFISLSRLK